MIRHVLHRVLDHPFQQRRTLRVCVECELQPLAHKVAFADKRCGNVRADRTTAGLPGQRSDEWFESGIRLRPVRTAHVGHDHADASRREPKRFGDLGSDEKPRPRPRKPHAPGLDDLAGRLSDRLETRVKIDLGKSKGKITVRMPPAFEKMIRAFRTCAVAFCNDTTCDGPASG